MKKVKRVRSCGVCKECCTFVDIRFDNHEPPFLKPAGKPCPYVNLADPASKKGCTVFGTAKRPVACGEFECDWLRYGLGRARPDKSGFLIESVVSINAFVATGAQVTLRLMVVSAKNKEARARCRELPLRPTQGMYDVLGDTYLVYLIAGTNGENHELRYHRYVSETDVDALIQLTAARALEQFGDFL